MWDEEVGVTQRGPAGAREGQEASVAAPITTARTRKPGTRIGCTSAWRVT